MNKVRKRQEPIPDFGRSFWGGVAVIGLLTLFAYSTVFTAGFIWDDDSYVTNNQHLRTVAGLAKIWFVPDATPQYYPLVFTIFWLQFHLWGMNPFGFHLVNILLHIGNAVMLWSCLRRLEIPAAFWAACIFAVHPVHVESVAWITELKNVLSMSFYLLAFSCYYRFSELSSKQPALPRKVWGFYALAFLFFLAALFSKTVSGSLPAAILLIFWWKQGTVPWKDGVLLLPFFILAIVLGRQTAQLEIYHVLANGPEWDISLIERVLIAGRAAWFYAAKLFWPYPLIFNYPRWHIDGGQWWQYLFPAGIGLLLLALWLGRDKIGKGPLVAVLFFIGTLFPALGFFNIYPMRYSFVADHFQYAASIGLIVLFCATIDRLFRQKAFQTRSAECILFGIILLTLSFLTWQQGKSYRSRQVLFNDVITKNPSSWMSYDNRGYDYFLLEKFDLAMADFQKSLELNPNDADALQYRAMILLKSKDYAKALADFNKAISLQPWRSDFYRNRSVLYWQTARYEEALADCTKALQLNSSDVEGYLRRSSIYGMREEYDLAMGDLSQALRLDPANVEAYANRGLVYYRQGRMNLAINDFNKALSLQPNSAPTYYNRGLAYAVRGDHDQAITDFMEARKRGYPLSEDEIQEIFPKK